MRLIVKYNRKARSWEGQICKFSNRKKKWIPINNKKITGSIDELISRANYKRIGTTIVRTHRDGSESDIKYYFFPEMFPSNLTLLGALTAF